MSWFPFYHVPPRDQIHVIRLRPPSYLTAPSYVTSSHLSERMVAVQRALRYMFHTTTSPKQWDQVSVD